MRLKSIAIYFMFLTCLANQSFASVQIRQLPSIMVGLFSGGAKSGKLMNFKSTYEQTEQLTVLYLPTYSERALKDLYGAHLQACYRTRLNPLKQTENFEHVVLVPMLSPQMQEFMNTIEKSSGFSLVVDLGAVSNALELQGQPRILKFKYGRLLDGDFD